MYAYTHVLTHFSSALYIHADVDECSEGTHQCADADDCMDTEGNYTCRPTTTEPATTTGPTTEPATTTGPTTEPAATGILSLY